MVYHLYRIIDNARRSRNPPNSMSSIRISVMATGMGY